MFGFMKLGFGILVLSLLTLHKQTQTQAQIMHHFLQQVGCSRVVHLEHLQLRNESHHHHRRFMNIPLVILCLALASCSPRKVDNNPLPIYSDMGAASDLGATKP